MKFLFKAGILSMLLLLLMASGISGASALTTWILPNSTSAATLQVGGSAVWLKVNSTAGKDVAGGSNATNMSFYYANSSGIYVLIGTNQSGSPVTVQNRTWSFVWDTTAVEDEWGPYTLLASATNSTNGILENQTIASVEVDNTLPTVSIGNAAGSKVTTASTVTCSVTNTRSITSLEFSHNGPAGPFSTSFTPTTNPAVTYTANTAAASFTPRLGYPPDGSVYARCTVSDGTNSTTSEVKNLLIDMAVQNNVDVSGQVATGIATGQIPVTTQKPWYMHPGVLVAVAAGVFVIFMSGNKK